MKRTSKPESVYDLLHKSMMASLRFGALSGHPTIHGTATEDAWLRLLSEHLPKRYQVERAVVIDCEGNRSEAQDIVVFDRQYCPFIVSHGALKLIPAESVYAVLEVKPQLNSETIFYAGRKAASVRRLKRTSAPIPHAGGVYAPKALHEVLGGLLATRCGPNDIDKSLRRALAKLEENQRLDLGVALDRVSFDARYEGSSLFLEYSDGRNQLLFFMFRLLARLQALATAPAIDFSSWEAWPHE